MKKADKVFSKILSGQSDKNITLEEAVSVLLKAGFILDGGKGSHRVFRHSDSRKMMLACHGKHLKPVYVRQLRELLKQ